MKNAKYLKEGEVWSFTCFLRDGWSRGIPTTGAGRVEQVGGTEHAAIDVYVGSCIAVSESTGGFAK